MKMKLLEIRDRATFIPVLAVDMNEPANDAERFLLRRAGYALDGFPIVMFLNAQSTGGPASYDPFTWPNRTFRHAHQYVTAHWHELESGDVVDVEHVLGETPEPKLSERFDNLFGDA